MTYSTDPTTRRWCAQNRRPYEETVSYEKHDPECLYRSMSNALAFGLPQSACTNGCKVKKQWCNILA